MPRPRAGGRARASGRHRRRRPLGCAPAHRAAALPGLVRLRAPARRVARRLGLRHPGALRAARLADREPRLLRHRRAARARASRRERSTRPASIVDAQVGRLRRGAGVEGLARTPRPCSRTSRLQDRLAPARARDRAGARLPGLLRPASAPGPARPDRNLLRQAGRRACGEALEAAYAAAPAVRRAPRGHRARALARPGHGRRRDRCLRPTARTGTGDRRLRARQPRQGRRGPGRAEREPRARPPRRRASGSRESSYERHRREGLRRCRCPLPASAGARRTSRSSARPCLPSAPRCGPSTRCWPLRSSSRSSTSTSRSRRRS